MRTTAGLLAGFLALAIAGEVESSDDVTISVSQSVYAAGDTVTVIVHNKSQRTLFVPGCHPFEVEVFEDERYKRVSQDPCGWEGVAAALPPGEHEFTFQSSEENSGGIFRVTMVYGWGCREGLPLSQSRCEDFATVSSGSYRVGQAG